MVYEDDISCVGEEFELDESAKLHQYEAVVRKHGNPVRVLAESEILRYIGELTGDAETRYRKINSVSLPAMAGVGEFEVGASVTIAQIDFIRELWAKEKRRNPSLTAVDFARDNAQSVFLPGIEICDP